MSNELNARRNPEDTTVLAALGDTAARRAEVERERADRERGGIAEERAGFEQERRPEVVETRPDPISQTVAIGGKPTRPSSQEPMMPLFSGNDSQALKSRWEAVQVSFVDEPKKAVEDANRLVSEAIENLTRGCTAERQKLEKQWNEGENVSTEDLRQAIRRYRSLFERLLSI
jgi:hypothetical protein